MKKMLLLLCLLFVWSSNEVKSQQRDYLVVNTELICPGIIFQIDAGLDFCMVLFPYAELIPFTQPSFIDCSAHGIEFIMSMKYYR
jgi:hypothetical protein